VRRGKETTAPFNRGRGKGNAESLNVLYSIRREKKKGPVLEFMFGGKGGERWVSVPFLHKP